ncbi:hypothetical protein ACSBR1_016596 [Camellia fascicularis]
MVFVNARLHVSGGALGGGRMVEDSSSVAVLDTAAGVWCDTKSVVTTLRTGRYSADAASGDATVELTRRCRHAAAAIGDLRFIYGGLRGVNSSVDCDASEFIDRDNTARVLIPLEHFKLPVLESSFFVKRTQSGTPGRSSSFSEKNAKAELNASIKNLISKIKLRWQSGRNSSGELNIEDAIQAALQTSVMDVLLPDPLTFGFKLAENSTGRAKLSSPKESINQVQSPLSKGSVLAHDMTSMEVLVRNNTKEMIRMSLSITCRDVAEENCIEGKKATVLWPVEFDALDSRGLQQYFWIFFGDRETIDLDSELDIIDGVGAEAGHVIRTTIGGRNGQSKQLSCVGKMSRDREIVAIKKVLQDKRYKSRELQIMKMMDHPNVLCYWLRYCYAAHVQCVRLPFV